MFEYNYELSEEQKTKLDNLQPSNLKSESRKSLIKYYKLVQGEESRKNFQYEYDDILDEMELIVEIGFNEFDEIAPKTVNKIMSVRGDKVYSAIKKNKLSSGLQLESNVEKKIENIRGNTRLSEEQKEKQVSERKAIFEECKELSKKGVTLNQDIAWKIWRIGQEMFIQEELGDEKLASKWFAKCEYLGKDFIEECKKIEFPEED